MRRCLIAVFLSICMILAGCSGTDESQQAPTQGTGEAAAALRKKELDDYSWDELSQISAKIAAATDDEEATDIAMSFGLVEDDGSLTAQRKMIVLDDTTAVDVRLAGIRHDDLVDGSGKAGLTFMTVGAVEIRAMNADATVDGGWEACEMRSYLNGDFKERLDDDLASALIPVNKLTNNKGFTLEVGDVTATQDEVWLFSVREVCGDMHWDLDEYRGRMGSHDPDAVLNAEGEQYQVFREAQVSCTSDPNGFLSLAESTGARPWWYRTPYPFEWEVAGPTGNNGFFCQVRESGYPESLGSPEVPAAVVIGFCV